MLSELFKPAWKSESVEKRRIAIKEMDGANAEHQQILSQLATNDEDSSVQIAAIQQLTSATTLHELSIKSQHDEIGREAEKRLNELLGSNQILDEGQCRELFNHFPELQLRIASHADSATLRAEAIETLSSDQLLDVLAQTVYTESRQQIAERLSDIKDLESARKIIRGKDKKAERSIKTRIDSFRQEAKQQAENLALVEKLIDEAEYLASHDWLPEFKARCQAHRRQWDSIEFNIDENFSQRYNLSRQIVDERYDKQLLIEQTRQSQQRLMSEFEELIRHIAGIDYATSIKAQTDNQEHQKQLIISWQALAEISQPDQPLLKQYDQIFKAYNSVNQFIAMVTELIQDSELNTATIGDNSETDKKCRQLEAAMNRLKWPEHFAKLQVADEIDKWVKDWRKEQKSAEDEYKKKLTQIHKKINSIFHFSRIGHLARAKRIAGNVEKTFNQFEDKDLSGLQDRYDEACKTLNDMGDWNNFATEPKYRELCEAMERLIDSKYHPDKLSKELKNLQQKWKALGHSDISEQYWPRFKLAADKVYQPCADFFAERNKTRKANLEQRHQYVEQMQTLLQTTDWENNPDYQAAQSSVRSISDQFTRIKEVERKAGQKQWKQFSSSKDAVMAKLDVAYEANIELKTQLLRQIEKLAESSASTDNIATLKSLQTRWKQIGITRRDQDQKIWREFKKQGDTVYQKVQQLRNEQRKDTDQQLAAYREIITDIQQLAKTATDLTMADQQFSALQANYAALPGFPRQLPEKVEQGVQRDYRKACDQYEQAQSQISKNWHLQQIDALRLKADLCLQQEALGITPSKQQLQKISEQWDSIELQSGEFSRRIEARKDKAQTTIDRTAIGEERRLLCIRLEIALDVESPGEDKPLRTQYQLEQMNRSGLGQQPVNNKEMIEAMELDWLCKPGAETGLQQKLDRRFRQVLRTWRK